MSVSLYLLLTGPEDMKPSIEPSIISFSVANKYFDEGHNEVMETHLNTVKSIYRLIAWYIALERGSLANCLSSATALAQVKGFVFEYKVISALAAGVNLADGENDEETIDR